MPPSELLKQIPKFRAKTTNVALWAISGMIDIVSARPHAAGKAHVIAPAAARMQGIM